MMMANEVIKIVCGIGEVLGGKMLSIDFLKNNFQTFSFAKDEAAVNQIKSAPLMQRKEYEIFCNGNSLQSDVKEISAEELRLLMSNGNNFQLIDVREPFEREEKNIGGDFIPFADVMSNADKISRDKKVIFYCKVGMRSHIIIQRLQEKFGMKNLYNLRGGISAFLQP
jgi:adenylyltransferase/sulfurtransferase